MGLNVAGDRLYAANTNLLPRGLLSVNQNTTATNSGVSSALGDVGPTATFTAVAGRFYRVTMMVSRASCTVASTCVMAVTNSANVVVANVGVLTMTAGADYMIPISFISTFTAGAQTVKLRASSSVATAVVFQATGFPTYVSVEDFGA
jgi:hypothetical protein